MRFLLLLLLLTGLTAECEQTTACSTFQKELGGKPRFLRDFSADAERAYTLQAGKLRAPDANLHEFAAFTAEKVKCDNTSVRLEGKRRLVVLNSATNALLQTNLEAPVKISVRVQDGSVDEALESIADLLFWSDGKEASASVPDYVAKSVPATLDVNTNAYVGCGPCGTGRPYAESSGLIVYAVGSKTRPPQLTRQVDPEFTAAAQRGQHNGEVLIGLIVGLDGKPHNIWVLRAVGYGLDESAGRAVAQYRFSPATKDGKPVAMFMQVAVNFQIVPQ